MDGNLNKLIKNFKVIRNKNWVPSVRKGPTGIGRTFEQLLSIQENNLNIPDYNGIEIKTKRHYSNAYTTLFNCNPINNIEEIKNKYGYPDKVLPQYKVLNNSIFSNNFTRVNPNFYFRLHVNRQEKRIYLYIYNKSKKLINTDTYWTFESLKTKLAKTKYLGFILALRKINSGKEYFKYYKLNIYKLKSFNQFIKLIGNSTIRITFKIGVFRTGQREGQTHNHGVGFDIKENDLSQLYDIVY